MQDYHCEQYVGVRTMVIFTIKPHLTNPSEPGQPLQETVKRQSREVNLFKMFTNYKNNTMKTLSKRTTRKMVTMMKDENITKTMRKTPSEWRLREQAPPANGILQSRSPPANVIGSASSLQCKDLGNWSPPLLDLLSSLSLVISSFLVDDRRSQETQEMSRALKVKFGKEKRDFRDAGCVLDGYESANALVASSQATGDNKSCKIAGISLVLIKMHNESERTIRDVRVLKDSTAVMKGNLKNGINYVVGRTIIGKAETAVKNEGMDQIKLWHMRLGHVSKRGLHELEKQGIRKDCTAFALASAKEVECSVPSTYYEAVNYKSMTKWLSAIDEEMTSLKKNKI
uniref:GAG-pre-integrase domain-containing protein n=1 Tax=Cannabis sativa TaxID=3483 RepID=A0A803QEP8_CANSA